MGILSWIFIGGLAGWFAGVLIKSKGSMGMPENTAVGIIGGIAGGFINSLLGGGGMSVFTLQGFGAALVGAAVMLAVVKTVNALTRTR